MEEMDEHPRISVLVDQLMEEMQRLNVDQGVFIKEAARIHQGRRDRRAMKKVEDVPGLRSLVSEFNLGEDTKKFNRTDVSSKSTYDCEVNREGKIGYYREKYDENCIIGEKDASRPICCIFDDDQDFLQIILSMLDYADAHEDEPDVAPDSYRRSLRELLPPHIPNGPSPRVDIYRYVLVLRCKSNALTFTDLSDASIVNVLRVGEQLFDKKSKWAHLTMSQLQGLSIKETLETKWEFVVDVGEFSPQYTLFPGGKNQLLAVTKAELTFYYRTFEIDMGDTLLADFFTKVDGRQRHDLRLSWFLPSPNGNDFSNTLRTLSDSKFRGEVLIAFGGHIMNISNQTFDNGLQIIVEERERDRVHIHFQNDNELLH